jgi:dihydroxyacetone kinase
MEAYQILNLVQSHRKRWISLVCIVITISGPNLANFARQASRWRITPSKIYSGMFETSLNGPGFSISLCNLNNAARLCRCSVSVLQGLLEAETKAPAWPNVASNPVTNKPPNSIDIADLVQDRKFSPNEDFIGKPIFNPDNKFVKVTKSIIVDSKLIEQMIRQACARAIAAEPDLTYWDMVMGDGDCGETVRAVCESM